MQDWDMAAGTRTASPLQRWAPLAIAAAAFGAGTIAALSGIAIAWPIAALFVGILGPRQRVLDGLALAVAAIWWSTLEGSLAPPLAFEGPDYGIVYGVPLLVLGSGLALWLGGRLAPPALPPATARRASRPPVVLGAGLGLVALGIALVTTAVQIAVPSRRSFEVSLGPGWNIVPGSPLESYYDPTYGAHFTAIWGPADSLPRLNPETYPVLGVTVIRTLTSARACISQVHGWSDGSGPVYAWEILSQSEVDLPSGRAYRMTRRAPGNGDARLYGWGFVRTRQVGILSEDLCYMVVLTTPTEAALTSDQADAIAATFRFR